MLGSGQQHLVRIRHNEVKCWPNLGRGRFGKGFVLCTLPFAYDEFNASRVLLADLDGSGAADLIYMEAERLRIQAQIQAACEGDWSEERLLQIGERFGVELAQVHMVGASLRDLQTAQAAGCVPHLVLTGRSSDVQGQTLPPSFPAHTRVHTDLAAFVDHLLGDASSMSLT